MAGSAQATNAKPRLGATDRYQTLDALRGVAAVIVVLYHAAVSFHLGGYSPPLSYLSVDLFFCLSGFVIALSYDPKMAAGMSTRAFMQKRIIRLGPLAFLGWTLSVATIGITDTIGQLSWAELAQGIVLNLFLLPSLVGQLFPLNAPGWSLFFELWVANLAYAAAWRWLRGKLLVIIISAAFVGLVICGRPQRWLNLGYDHLSIMAGFARVIFSFFAGVAVQRFHARKPAPFEIPSFVICLILVTAMCIPVSGRLGLIYQVFCVSVVFPAIVYFGASAKERRPKIGKALGDASYAAYTIHWPILCFVAWLVGHRDLTSYGAVFQIGITALIVLLAISAHHAFDEPLRERIRGWLRH